MHELLVIRKLKKSPFKKDSAWLCRCDCGRYTIKRQCGLVTGHIKSCGCLSSRTARAQETIHGLSKHPLYFTWNDMLQRCYKVNCKAYPRYGGRGIQVCERWRASVKNFINDVSPKPSSAHTLDRINNDGHYEPGNVRWATRKEQSYNRQNNKKVVFGNNTVLARHLAQEMGVSYERFRWYLRKGFTAEAALEQIKKRSSR